MRPIIVEGPDGTGKSTLVEELIPYFNLRQHERLWTKPNTWDLVKAEADHTLANMVPGVVFDRCVTISQAIYGRYREDMPDFLTVQYTTLCRLNQQVRQRRPIFVVCLTRVGEHILKGHDTPEYVKWLEEHHNNILRCYYDFALFTGATLHSPYDTESTIQHIIEENSRG